MSTLALIGARDTAAVASDRDEAGRDDVAYSTFGGARRTWLGRLDKVRNVVRQEMIARQLGRHMRGRPGRIVDVDAGQGTQSVRLARAGHQVLAAFQELDLAQDERRDMRYQRARHTGPG